MLSVSAGCAESATISGVPGAEPVSPTRSARRASRPSRQRGRRRSSRSAPNRVSQERSTVEISSEIASGRPGLSAPNTLQPIAAGTSAGRPTATRARKVRSSMATAERSRALSSGLRPAGARPGNSAPNGARHPASYALNSSHSLRSQWAASTSSGLIESISEMSSVPLRPKASPLTSFMPPARDSSTGTRPVLACAADRASQAFPASVMGRTVTHARGIPTSVTSSSQP